MNGRSKAVWATAAMVAGLWGCAGSGGGSAHKSASYAPSEAASPSPMGMGDSGAAPRSEAPSAQQRPGLGTTWGETRTSHISSAPFSRADSSSPFATSSVFYDNATGAKKMAAMSGATQPSDGRVPIGGGVASLRLKDGQGRFLTGLQSNSKHFIVGQDGDRYTIVIQSHVPARLEVVVSVDGLDVLDGKSASVAKRGYLIDPHGVLEIDGFRQSMDAVAAFRFGSVQDSYAEKKHGDARNVGVIGVALFNEKGTNPASWPIGDAQNRLNADPFPGKFATPP
jgi:hypothetical protein